MSILRRHRSVRACVRPHACLPASLPTWLWLPSCLPACLPVVSVCTTVTTRMKLAFTCSLPSCHDRSRSFAHPSANETNQQPHHQQPNEQKVTQPNYASAYALPPSLPPVLPPCVCPSCTFLCKSFDRHVRSKVRYEKGSFYMPLGNIKDRLGIGQMLCW